MFTDMRRNTVPHHRRFGYQSARRPSTCYNNERCYPCHDIRHIGSQRHYFRVRDATLESRPTIGHGSQPVVTFELFGRLKHIIRFTGISYTFSSFHDISLHGCIEHNKLGE
jgi:hypothetical protein